MPLACLAFAVLATLVTHVAIAYAIEANDVCLLQTERVLERQAVNEVVMSDASAPEGWRSVLTFQGSDQQLGHPGQEHSQSGQDWVVASILGCKKDGYFVDLAANDAEFLSNTLMLERDFDWNGACIDANAKYISKLTKRRCQPVLAAVGAPRGKEVQFNFHNELGGIVGFDQAQTDESTENVTLVPLADILEELQAPNVIDYFSLDVEGAESLVMEGFPWEKYSFRVLTVERPKPDLQRALVQNGYHFLIKNSAFDDETWINENVESFDQIMRLYSGNLSTMVTCMTRRGHPLPHSFGDAAVNASSVH
eukprot:TRINITY_DN41160_c0_g1_i1.p1 TRINITY_DN41160_c0_g1~~TRINITY_DN41160_c0_g1_i1.p1  ORF type:complete len:309 (+),score=40.41 TRINITY_DN41160_c0_g1_i1:60-986(+)